MNFGAPGARADLASPPCPRTKAFDAARIFVAGSKILTRQTFPYLPTCRWAETSPGSSGCSLIRFARACLELRVIKTRNCGSRFPHERRAHNERTRGCTRRLGAGAKQRRRPVE